MSRRQIERRLKRDGWYLDRRGVKHDIFAHPDTPEKIVLPRHRVPIPRGHPHDSEASRLAREREALMKHYPALLDQGNGVYGVVFPDLPGVAAVGDTVEEALENAVEALRDYVDAMEQDGFDYTPPSDLFDIDVPTGNVATLVPLVRPSGEKVGAAQA